MLRSILILLFFSWLLPGSNGQPQRSLRIMSFNIRLNTPDDGENAWPYRKDLVKSVVLFHHVDVLGVQEALPDQMEDLDKLLPDFGHTGEGRDGNGQGEFSAIFYRKSKVDLINEGTFWLSETPEKVSKGWDAALNRICSWAEFQPKRTTMTFFLFNTHFDHKGTEARKKSAELLRAKIREIAGDKPVILGGDFNATPDEEPYKIITCDGFLKDGSFISDIASYGPQSTWSGFKVPGEQGRRIDYIFVNDKVAVTRYGNLSESWSGRYPSDHLPVLAEILFNVPKPLKNAHSHNDYEQSFPLRDAIRYGFTSAEADTWLIDGELCISHNRPSRKENIPTFELLYLRTLELIMRYQGGKIYPGYDIPFLLLIDLKNKGEEQYHMLNKILKNYDWMLKTGVVKMVLSGDRPVATALNDPNRVLCMDGRPEDLGKGYSAEFMPLVSENYNKFTRWKGEGTIPEKEFSELQAFIKRAHDEGKKVRLWTSPENEEVWKMLINAGVDYINTDELERLSKFLLENAK